MTIDVDKDRNLILSLIGADEFVEIADLVSHAEVYVEAADRFLRRAS